MSYVRRRLHPTVQRLHAGDDHGMSTTPAPQVPENPPPERPVPGRPLEEDSPVKEPPLPGKDNPVIAPGGDKNPVKKLALVAMVMGSFALVGACGRETSPEMPMGEPSATMPSAPTTTDPDAGAVNPESPEAGLNSKRPDGTEDVAPGSDTGAGTSAGTATGTP